MRNLSKKAKTIIAGAAIAGLASTGVAYAYWTTTGSGNGTATTAAAASTITVHQTSTPTNLTPGGTPQLLAGDFTNGNTSSVSISSVTADVTSVTNTGSFSTPACTVADYAIGSSAAGSLVPVGVHGGSWTGLTIALVDNGLNQDNCKGATPHITYTANP